MRWSNAVVVCFYLIESSEELGGDRLASKFHKTPVFLQSFSPVFVIHDIEAQRTGHVPTRAWGARTKE